MYLIQNSYNHSTLITLVITIIIRFRIYCRRGSQTLLFEISIKVFKIICRFNLSGGKSGVKFTSDLHVTGEVILNTATRMEPFSAFLTMDIRK